ncbi:MAG: DUF4012 domain-containing protein [Candidatus Jorgensenbacteria bacterium]|nr:DUF4012 domain-containing protein [Candidatus Jorgensenbacteria bacterium]
MEHPIKRKVSAKNIDPVLFDVRHPDLNYERIMRTPSLDLARIPQAPKRNTSGAVAKIIGAFSFIMVGILFVFVAKTAVQTRDVIKNSSSAISGNFQKSVEALSNLDPEAAQQSLTQNNKDLATLDALLENGRGKTLTAALGWVVPAFKSSGSLIGGITGLNIELLKISQIIADAKQNGFKYFESDGATLLARLGEARDAISAILAKTQDIKNTTASLKQTASLFDGIDSLIGNQYIAHSAALYGAEEFLNNLLALLKRDTDTHVAILFQNPAEIRPGGGFLGSYADITVRGGQMVSLDVRDIYDPDGWVFSKIIPPKPLQKTTTDWEARDANWFFDFPTSAKTVLGFLESSKMYEERGIKFDAAVAININVLETLLDVTGSIPLDEYKLTIDSENFLHEIQREVEAGKDNKAGHPKRILKILAPILFERLGALTQTEQKALLTRFEEHFAKKDIMVYAKDDKIQSFIASSGLSGAVYELPSSFWGSYLAVVNTNIAGGKSDAFVKETVRAAIDIGTDGSALTNLTVTRAHSGDTQTDSWWKSPNQDYIKIFTNPETMLLNAKGNIDRNSVSSFDYETGGYKHNPDLLAIEETEKYLTEHKVWSMIEDGKNVFATWFTVLAGESKDLELRYQTTQSDSAVVAPGNIFEFIFEKQSGVENEFQATISAPLGYVWQETGNTVFTYEDKNPEGRTIIKLTLALLEVSRP